MELNCLKVFFKNLDFFAEYINISSSIMPILKYQFCPNESIIDKQTKFKILLEGSIKNIDTEVVVKGPLMITEENWQTLTKCHIAYMENENYDKCLCDIEMRNLNIQIDFFQSLPLFAKWSRTAIQRIIKQTDLMNVARHDIIYSAGNIPKYVYVVDTGEYEILKVSAEKKEKKIYLENYIGPPKERERRKKFYEMHLLNRKNIGENFTVEELTLLVFVIIIIA